MTMHKPFAFALLLAALATTQSLAFGGKGGAMGFDFDSVDADKDGKLTATEMDAYQQARLAGVDADKDGFVTGAELQAFVIARMAARAATMATARIEAQDTDKDGRLSPAELADAPRAQKLFARMDGDGDGAISREEIASTKARLEAHRAGQKRHKGGMFGFWGDEPQAE